VLEAPPHIPALAINEYGIFFLLVRTLENEYQESFYNTRDEPIGLPLVDKFRTADWIQFERELQFSGLLELQAFKEFALA